MKHHALPKPKVLAKKIEEGSFNTPVRQKKAFRDPVAAQINAQISSAAYGSPPKHGRKLNNGPRRLKQKAAIADLWDAGCEPPPVLSPPLPPPLSSPLPASWALPLFPV